MCALSCPIGIMYGYNRLILSCSCPPGGRQAADIVTWLKKKTGPPAVTLETVDAAKAMVEKDEVVIFGLFKVSGD